MRLAPTNSSHLDTSLKVESIINHHNHCWDLSQIRDIIDDRSKAAILALPLGDGSAHDRLVWPHHPSGSYTVRSGYQFQHRYLQTVPISASTSRWIPKEVWKLIWKARLPPKIKNFLWKTAKGCLPTKAALFRRHLGTTPICPLCSSDMESPEHLFLTCPWVDGIWLCGALNLKIDKQLITTFDSWLLQVTSTTHTPSIHLDWTFTHIAFTCWHIWKLRCSAVFDHINPNPVSAIHSTRVAVAEYLNAISPAVNRPLAEPPDPTSQHWSPPPPHFTKINVDASWDHNSYASGQGIIVRNSSGDFLAAKACHCSASSALEAKAYAGLNGCLFAVEMGLRNIIIESDSKILIRSITGPISNGNWKIYPILLKIRAASRNLNINWSWARRSANAAADAVASIAKRSMCNEVWASRPPSSLVHVLTHDGLPCPPPM